MSVSGFLDLILENPRFSGYVSHVHSSPSQLASVLLPPDILPLQVKEWLKREKMELYSHQVEAVQAIVDNTDVLLCTPTASGKTLSFLLPFLVIREKEPKATSLILYPAKALTRDQLRMIESLEKATGISVQPAIYDGDTPRHDRPGIRSSAGMVLTNPYELHQILPWHRQWSSFLSRLRYVVLDETHLYRGVFGSSMAFVLRRLLRVCEYYGSSPRFFLASATMGNPKGFAELLTGRKVHVITKNGAPAGERYFVLYNPYQETTKPRSVYSESAELLCALVDSGLQTLCFTGSRRMTELVSVWAKNRLSQISPSKGSSIAAYRAGYLPNERKRLEDDLKCGKIRGIVSTNALELGIDIGSLDAVILTGYPGTMMSVWQQAGRAGRMASDALAILVAMQNPLDQFFMRHPKEFFSRPHEYAIIDTKNPYILSGQLLCAASELPINTESDLKWFGPDMQGHLDLLASTAILSPSSRGYVYSGIKRAADLVSLSQISETWTVECRNQILETLDLRQACREAHPGGVLLHQGEKYLVEGWDAERHRIIAKKEDPGYYTRVNQQIQITIRERSMSRPISSGMLFLGHVEVSECYSGYRKVLDDTILSVEPLSLPPVTFDTVSVWIELSSADRDRLSLDHDLAGSLHGAEHALIAMLPYHVLCDRWDLGGMSTPSYPESSGKAVIFIYDGYEGGIGLSEKAYHIYEELCRLTESMVRECGCKDGCPACIYSPKCGNDNQPLDKDGCIAFLQMCAKPVG